MIRKFKAGAWMVLVSGFPAVIIIGFSVDCSATTLNKTQYD